ncbi:MAG: hypothetical protein AAF709_11155 [Pseudomonadota bacterium]
MAFIADILMSAGALAAGFYCFVLSRRLRRFTDLEKGVGGAIAVLSVQVDDLTKTLKRANQSAATSAEVLSQKSHEAETVAKRLEILVASMHDLPEPKPPQEAISPFFVRRPAQTEPEVEMP